MVGGRGARRSRLHADLAEANGFRSFALVDVADHKVITVAVDRANRTVSPSDEDHRP